MKTKLLLLLLLANFSISAQTNLVQNGKFESWQPNGTPTTWTVQNTVKRQSYISFKYEFCANLSLTNSAERPKMTAEVPLTAGVTYTVKFKYKYVNANFNGSHPISLNISQDGAANTLSSSTFASNNEWTIKETTFTADQSLSYNLSISTYSFDDEAFDVLIDDVKVYPQGTEQYTLIPDPNFEKALNTLKIDTGESDCKVLTEDIVERTDLNVSSSGITDLTGIQDFKALETIYCFSNQLTSVDFSHNTALKVLELNSNKLTNLDVSNNTKLTTLHCSGNLLTSLDLSHNLNLTDLEFNGNKLTAIDVSAQKLLTNLDCSHNELTSLDTSNNKSLRSLLCRINKITALDVSQNTELTKFTSDSNKLTALNVVSNTKLEYLSCSYNEISSLDVSTTTKLKALRCVNTKISTLDVSNNTALFGLNCRSNPLLNTLNLKNGNNGALLARFDFSYNSSGSGENSDFTLNPNLSCILVDNATFSDANWSTFKDAKTSFSTSCNLGVGESVLDQAAIYPNPTKGEVTIDNVSLEKATVYNSLGQLVKSFTLDTANSSNTINLSGLPKGIYYVYLINQDAASAKKVIVE